MPRSCLLLALLCFAAVSFSWSSTSLYSTKIYLGGNVEVSLYTPTMFRVRISQLQDDKFPAKYEIPFVMGKTDAWPPVEYRRWEEGGFDLIETSQLRIRISPLDHSWTVWSTGGEHQIYPSEGPIYGMFRDGYTVFDSASALGERTDYSRFSHWFYSPETHRYVDTYLDEDLVFDQFFIYGPNYDKLFQQLNQLVGPEPLLPKKAYGFFQTQHLGCKGTQAQLMEVAQELRDRHIPSDTLMVDYEWGDGCPGGDQDDKYWGGLEWADAYKTPLSPREMVVKLHEMHFDVMLIHHSAPDFPHRAEDVRREPKREWTSKVYDEKLWWNKLHEQLDLGIDGTWQDTRKNDVTDSVIWKGFQDYYGTSRRVLFLGNRNMVEVDPWELQRDDRFPSNSLLASRRYPFRWTGDAHTTWSELQWHIDAITNTFGPMAGIDYITADAYAADWKQQARWNQFLAFSPVTRSHTMKPWDIKLDIQSLTQIMAFGDKRNPSPTVPTMPAVPTSPAPSSPQPDNAELERLARSSSQTLPTAENSIRNTLRLRYRLLPYLYSMAYAHYRTGFPITRPVVLAFPNDLHGKFNRLPYQYMYGDAFLVAPVWADLNTMEIYLPEGQHWIDYWSKRTYPGGQTIAYDSSNIEKLPLFVKAGSIIPMRPDEEWIDPSRPDDPLTLDIYPSAAPSTFTLYEDDGVSTLYQSGQSATTSFGARLEPTGDITIELGQSQGQYHGKPGSRTYVVDVNLISEAPPAITRGGQPVARSQSFAALANATEGWAFDSQQQKVRVKVVQKASDSSTLSISSSPATINKDGHVTSLEGWCERVSSAYSIRRFRWAG
jgi:alpha-glucosidase (family GH31 glycosyl hydrolase)